MNSQRYTLPAIALHWGQAILIAWLLWLGWTMVDLPKGAERSAAYGLHKSLGLLALLLVVVRLAWRRGHPAPSAISGGWEARLAMVTHYGLYALLALVPLAGYLASSFTTYATKFFGVELPRIVAPSESFNAIFKLLHEGLVWGIAALIVLHVAGAVKHAMLRDGTLQRMLPGRLFRN
ncbi:cytochrome b [Dechloromonas sp. HYN0024]|uniref:cytochrome b n=1 Tax=Dechloromonas sp. HYN0024 TaxID=2231055 RepID=UPI000E44EA64|nr:cytochrome b [Dechloromonas sp. HYN0024]AXS80500.1 cytochrome b [Dechloromonas sp. HYN0024]